MINVKDYIKHNRTPWPQITHALEEQYEILDYFELGQYDFRPNVMAFFWSKYSNYKFLPNQRIVITQYDLNFYLPGSTISTNLYNLFLILNFYNIPTDFLIFLIGDYSESEIETLSDYFNLPRPNIVRSVYFLEFLHSEYQSFAPANLDKIQHHFICLNGNQRPFRLDLLCLLENKNLLEKGIVSYNFSANSDYLHLPKEAAQAIPDVNIGLINVQPFNRTNERYIKNIEIVEANQRFLSKFQYQTHRHRLIDVDYRDRIKWETPTQQNSWFIQSGGIDLVVETAMTYPYPFISEKTWKAITYSRPFIIAGPPGIIKRLHDLGFKTFDCFWDESYDNILDTSKRLCYISSIVEKICALPLSQIRELVSESESIYQHNFFNYIGNFRNNLLDQVINKIKHS